MLNVPHSHTHTHAQPYTQTSRATSAFHTFHKDASQDSCPCIFISTTSHIREIRLHQFILLLATRSVAKTFILSYLFCSTLISLRVSFEIDLFAFGLICTNINTNPKKNENLKGCCGWHSHRCCRCHIFDWWKAHKIMRFIRQRFLCEPGVMIFLTISKKKKKKNNLEEIFS